jgi:hypothetical protein
MDRVKFEPLERADLEDIKALTDLAYEYDQRALGALLGAADLSANDGGLLSGPSLTYVHATGLLTLSSFSYLELTAGGAPLDSNGNSLSPEARVIRFDSSVSSHINSPVDISAARTVGTTYTLYARSIRVASDTSARRRWDVSSAQEVSYSPTTRYRERVEFTASASAPAEATSAEIGRWAPLLTYEVDSGGTLTHTYISALDHADARAIALAQPGLGVDRLTTRDYLVEASAQSTAHGLLGLLSSVKLALHRLTNLGAFDELHTPASADTWFRAPPLSSEEIKLRIERLETRNQAVQDRASELETVSDVVIRVQATWSSSANTSYSTIDAPQGVGIIYDGADMSGSDALGDATLSEADFKRALRRPVVTLPTPSAGKAWKVWRHNIRPLNAPSIPDSLTDTSHPQSYPLDFDYGVIFAEASSSPPLSTDLPPTRSLIKQSYTISPATAPSTPTTYPQAVPFIIRMEPAYVNSNELKFIYDIQLTIQEVDA